MSEPLVRPATVEDLGALAPRLATLPLFTAYGLDAARLASRWTDGLAKGDGLLVAETPGQLLGLCWFLPRGVFGTAGYLRTIALVPEAHGRGIGPLLLKAFEEGCGAPSGGWFLLTSDFNEGAQRFYRRHGYQEVGRLPPGFASSTIGEVVFWKPRKT
jgi:ribosomal protein S18 acetylase RimI-like enzyme